jgi:PAS domain S-box-containing protein
LEFANKTLLAHFVGVVLLSLLLLGSSTRADDILSLNSAETTYHAGSHVSYVIDKEGKLSVDDFSGQNKHTGTTNKNNFHIALGKSIYWLKVEIRNETAQANWFLEAAPPNVDLIELFELSSSGEIVPGSSQRAGDLIPMSDWSTQHHVPYFHVYLPQSQNRTLLLRVQSTVPADLPLRLLSKSAFEKEAQLEKMLFGAFFGMIAALALYNAVLFVFTRESSFIWYFVYSVFFGLVLFAAQGFAKQYFWPNSVGTFPLAGVIFGSFSLAATFQFSRKFLATADHNPFFDKFLLAWIAIMLFNAGVGVLGATTIAYLILLISTASAGFALEFAGILAWHRGYRPARYYLLAFFFSLIGCTAYALKLLGVVPDNFFTSHALYFTYALEMLCLSVALADRINHVNRVSLQMKIKEARFEQILDNMPISVSLKDINGRYLMGNRFFTQIRGMNQEDFVGKTEPELASKGLTSELDAVTLGRIESQIFSRRDAVQSEEELPLGGGRYFSTIRFILPAAGELADSLCTISMEITKSKELAAQLSEQQAHLAHMDRLNIMGEMASGIAHELNQPLSAILTYNQTSLRLLKDGHEADVKINELLQAAIVQTRRAAEIIRRLRTFATKRPSQMAQLNINSTVLNAIALDQHEIDSSEAYLVTELEAELIPVFGDAIQIEQVLVNLIRNALDAMADNPAEKKKLRVTTSLQQDGYIAVSVSDNGCGVVPDLHQQIFMPFFTTKAFGLGLGLAISTSIVESHGGILSVTQNSGGGSIFTFTLPVSEKAARKYVRDY